MAEMRYDAGALRDLLLMYADALALPNLRKAGTRAPVDDGVREAALEKVRGAADALATLCEQRVLGIVVTIPDES